MPRRWNASALSGWASSTRRARVSASASLPAWRRCSASASTCGGDRLDAGGGTRRGLRSGGDDLGRDCRALLAGRAEGHQHAMPRHWPPSRARLRPARRHWPMSRPSTWRNSRIVGYHGLSSRPRSQRQSDTHGVNSQVGLASAPAKCDTAESMVMTRSSAAIAAAVAAKPTSLGRNIGDLEVAMRLEVGGTRPDLETDEGHALHLEQRRQLLELDRAPPVVDMLGIAGPGEPDLQPGHVLETARASARPRPHPRADRARAPEWFRAACRRCAAGSIMRLRNRQSLQERHGRPAPRSRAGSGAEARPDPVARGRSPKRRAPPAAARNARTACVSPKPCSAWM